METKALPLADKLATIMAEIGPIKKKKHEGATVKFAYRSIDEVMNALNPLLATYAITLQSRVSSFKTTRVDGKDKYGNDRVSYLSEVVVAVIFSDGKETETWEEYAISEDFADKSATQAMSMAFKYAILRKFCITTEDMTDPDSRQPERPEPTPEKPFLNERDEDYKAAEVALRSGQPASTVIGNLRKAYRLSKAVNEKLEAIKPTAKKDRHHITTADLMEYHEIINSGGTVDPKDTKRSTSLRGIAHTVASLKSKAVDMAKVKEVYTLDEEVEAFFAKVANV